MKSLLMLLSVLCLGLLFAVTVLAAQNATQPGAFPPRPKYRTHFVIYDVQKKTTKTIFTVEGEWHAPRSAAGAGREVTGRAAYPG